jgi:putative transposase
MVRALIADMFWPIFHAHDVCSDQKQQYLGDNKMTNRKRHSQAEIASKLAEADALVARGKSQREIAGILGVSVMTFHRWRKSDPAQSPQSRPSSPTTGIDQRSKPADRDRVTELQLENSRLRRLLTDMLLEKSKLEEESPLRGANSKSIEHAPQ